MTQIQRFERKNGDKRFYKIVHHLDGRATPASPTEIYLQASELAERLNMENVDVVVGFAEGGLIPAFAVAAVSGKAFVGSYRVRLQSSQEIHFTEPHSKRSDHYIYALKPGDRIAIVEDEITSGSTLLNAITSLENAGITVVDIGAYIMNCDETVIMKFIQRGFAVKFLHSMEVIYE